MKTLKAVLVFLSFIIFLVAASLGHILVTLVKPSRRRHLINSLSCFLIRTLQKILGMRVSVKGHKEALKKNGNFIISRHVSYTDGLVLGGLIPAMLLSKSEIKNWPLIGLVVMISGTVFVDRRQKNKIPKCLEDMVRLLREKINVVVFPEGTSTDGTVIKPFQTVFFRVPIGAQSSIVPVTISYKSLNGEGITPANKNDIYWYGQISFFKHLWNLFRFRFFDVEVTIHDKIPVGSYGDNSLDRKKLSQKCFNVICEAAGIQPEISKEIEQENGDFVLFARKSTS